MFERYIFDKDQDSNLKKKKQNISKERKKK